MKISNYLKISLLSIVSSTLLIMATFTPQKAWADRHDGYYRGGYRGNYYRGYYNNPYYYNDPYYYGYYPYYQGGGLLSPFYHLFNDVVSPIVGYPYYYYDYPYNYGYNGRRGPYYPRREAYYPPRGRARNYYSRDERRGPNSQNGMRSDSYPTDKKSGPYYPSRDERRDSKSKADQIYQE